MSIMNRHTFLEKHTGPLVAAILVVVSIGGLIEIAAPIFHEGRLVGAAMVTVPIKAVARPASEIVLRQVLIALGSMLIFLPIVALAVRKSLGPIQTLTEAARLASSRKLDLRIDVRTGDELEVLANAFNRMFGRLEASVKRIQRLAYVDMVTELPNRERFRKELERVCVKAGETGTTGAVLFLDLDRFKRVNDSLGIGEGDRLLEAVARRLREAARGWDLVNSEGGEPSMVARLGGDEFTLLLPQLKDGEDAARVARRVVDAVRRPFEISGHQVFLGLSVGVALFPRDGSDPETLLRHADLAMATAKRAGGNAYEFFESKMNQSAFERLVLENELREAVSDDQLVVYYQPKVTMKEGALAGAEALVRWQHPTAGLLSPGAFIQAAEECGLIGDIGNYVLRKSCQEFARLHKQGLSIPVAVNVSAMQFESAGFSDIVLDALNESGLPPHMLELELTESTAMRDPERVIQQIEPLRKIGVTFAIDDFGTGHSSLSYLTRMPFDVFKIDQSFVRGIEDDPHARIVVETNMGAVGAILAHGTEAQRRRAAELVGDLVRRRRQPVGEQILGLGQAGRAQQRIVVGGEVPHLFSHKIGKSHLAQAIGHELIKAGKIVLYRSIFDILSDLREDGLEQKHERTMKRYLKCDLLIIDDMGVKQLPPKSGEYLFEIIMRRYELRSTLMTSNRPLEEWGKLIGDVPAATAILDRFLHHAQLIKITGKSHRMKDAALNLRDSS